MSDELFDVWITKYALTKGIMQKRAMASSIGGLVRVPHANGYGADVYHVGDWHRTEADALAKAEKMRKSKVAALKRQIAKMRALRFGP